MCLRAARALAALLVAALVALLRRALGRPLLGRALRRTLLRRTALASLERRNGATGNGRGGLLRQVDLETTTERATRLETRLERLLERAGRQDGLSRDSNLGNLTTSETARAARRRLTVGAGLAAKVAALGLGTTDLALRARLTGLAASTTLDNIDTGRLHLLHTVRHNFFLQKFLEDLSI
jgi:hypothetical protein